MTDISRRKLILGGLATAAGVSALGVAARIAQKYGLVPPDHGGIYGLGETLTYASQRLLTRHSLAREFSRSQISNPPFANEIAPLNDAYKRLQAGGFADWRLTVDGMVDRPASFSLDQLKSYPRRSQITHLACEAGWSYIAEWIGVPLSYVLDAVGVKPQARYVAYFSIEPDWWDSVDMADALHPQTFLAYGMNGKELPVGNGGPLRIRIPRHLGYKSVKFVTHLTVTDSMKGFGQGLGSASPEGCYSWYAVICLPPATLPQGQKSRRDAGATKNELRCGVKKLATRKVKTRNFSARTAEKTRHPASFSRALMAAPPSASIQAVSGYATY